MAFQPADQKRIERFICSVCIDVFREPKLLPCHHTFCLACLHDLLHSSPKPSSFHCPNCRASVSVPPGGLESFQNNFYLLPEDLEAARIAVSQTGGGSTAPYDQNQVAGDSLTEPLQTATTNDANSDWLIAYHLTEQEPPLDRDESHSGDTFSAIPEEHQEEEGGGELKRAIEESLKTYQDEVQRRQEVPPSGQLQGLRGLQTAVASEALKRWSQRRRVPEPNELLNPRSEEPPEHGVQEEQRCEFNEIPRFQHHEREEKVEPERGRRLEQKNEQVVELQRKFSEILSRRSNQGAEQEELQKERQERYKPQTEQETQSEFLQVFKRLGTKRRDDRPQDRPSNELGSENQSSQDDRSQEQSEREEERFPKQDKFQPQNQATQGQEEEEREQETQGQPEHREAGQTEDQGPQCGSRPWQHRPPSKVLGQSVDQHQTRESDPRSELDEILLRRQQTQGEPRRHLDKRRSDQDLRTPATKADVSRRRQTLPKTQGEMGQLQKELAQVLGKRNSSHRGGEDTDD